MIKRKILIVDDDKDILSLMRIKLKNESFLVKTENSPLKALDIISSEEIDLIIVDQQMPEITGLEFIEIVKEQYPEMPIILMTAYGQIEDAVKAIKIGALHYITKPINYEELKHVINQAFEITSLKEEIKNLKDIISDEIIVESKKMRDIIETAKKVAPFDATVLITGESGTGKEVIARFIHKHSKRAKKSFIAINCGAIPENLLEAELFGYQKGAFTGADFDKKGLIEEANGGTLFLDEIGELPLNLQVKLLRVIQEQEIKPLGSNKSKKINVRFIAATNKNLEKLVKIGAFREDLYYRLNVIKVNIPPLRKRKEDIIPLAQFFIKKYSLKYGIKPKTLSKKAEEDLLNYDWPGNVRELENTIERLLLTTSGNTIRKIFKKSSTVDNLKKFRDAKEEFEKRYIEKLLEKTKGNISKASRISGLTRAQIYRYIKKYNISF
ncbi:sigma-54 dependent transcriptional regulator [Persephonella sp.]|uniref:sigma-54-dependent transcriptional regulator n=1 Tax=Persephonella sp. TaxID=2060922 RepID=UPI002604D25E|nr:sigma-54 dependent transcriptional regulator [Persephonella sp.]